MRGFLVYLDKQQIVMIDNLLHTVQRTLLSLQEIWQYEVTTPLLKHLNYGDRDVPVLTLSSFTLKLKSGCTGHQQPKN